MLIEKYLSQQRGNVCISFFDIGNVLDETSDDIFVSSTAKLYGKSMLMGPNISSHWNRNNKALLRGFNNNYRKTIERLKI